MMRALVITLRQVAMTQPSSPGVPAFTLHASVVRRIASEFREMPGLVLTVAQASRFLDVDEASCERILTRLEKKGLLRRRAGGAYALA